jgi:hypothetical protein
MIEYMLEISHWLWPNDYDFIQSISKQLKYGKELSDKHLRVIKDIYGRFMNNQQPKYFSWGSLGSGKRK